MSEDYSLQNIVLCLEITRSCSLLVCRDFEWIFGQRKIILIDKGEERGKREKREKKREEKERRERR